MLNSSVFGVSGKVAGRRSSFSQTYALLGQYMNEKKALGDLNFEMASNIDDRRPNDAFRRRTMNLFPVNERAEKKAPTSGNGKSSPLPQPAGFTALKPNSSEIQSAPMTIFYAGQVVVFNDFPAHKAKEFVELASQSVSRNPKSTAPIVATNGNDTNHLVVDSTTLAPPSLSTHVFPTSLGNKHQMQEPAQRARQPNLKDLPVARRASLHRFLEKRKDRITAKAPYSTGKPGDMPSKWNPNERNSWLGLAAGEWTAPLNPEENYK